MLVAITLLLAVSLVAVLFFLFKQKNTEQAKSQALRFEEVVSLLENRLNSLQQQLDTRLRDQNSLLSNTQNQIGLRLENATQVVGQVHSRLGQLEEANRRIFDVGKDIQSLQDILRSPKQRGILGELFLEELLAQILPNDRYKLQYAFKNNEKVDAVICLAHGLVSVDAKFPLENFRRFVDTKVVAEQEEYYRLLVSDTKKHIDAISAKYIVPDEGTLDFALMYIPAENVFYELTISGHRVSGQRSLIEYALEKRVIPVSPNTFFAYLQTILLGLRGLKIEERARSIQDLLGRLRLEFGKLNEDLTKLGTHLNNASGSYDKSMKRMARMQGRMGSLEDGESAAESQLDAQDPLSLPSRDR